MTKTPEDKWRAVLAAQAKKEPNKLTVFIELRRPEENVVIFEAPQYGLTVRYDRSPNFATRLKDFIRELSPMVRNAPEGKIDVILTCPDWSTDNAVG